MFNVKIKPVVLAVASVLAATSAFAADAIKADKVDVISTTPLAGFGISADKIPANVQVVDGEKMREQGSLTIADFMNSNMQGVNVVETQGNPFQPDVTFHGFNANALLGSPQGLAVYQDGVRINEPFGDVVSWDLVPMNAIKQMQLIPGTNPLFGLNALGGAVSLQTKRGRDIKGGSVELSGGSWGRKNTQFQYGNVLNNGVDFFISGNYFDEDGWRDASPTTVKQMFGQLGWQDEKTDLSLTVSLADNSMTGNGLTPQEMLKSLGNKSIYTKPDQTDNKMVFVNLTGSRWLTDQAMLSGNAYYRHVTTDTFNGDTNEATEQGALLDTNTTRNPSGLTAQQLFAAACQAGTNSSQIFSGKGSSVPSGATGATGVYADASADTSGTLTRKYVYDVGNLTPEYACNAILNKTTTKKNGAGGSVQLAYNQPLAGHDNQVTVGMTYDYSNIKFGQSGQYGVLTADRGVSAVPYFSDDANTSLDGTTNTWGVFATNTFSINEKLHLTASGRYNNVNVDNFDNLVPAGEIKSLTARHTFQRFNPAVGLTFKPMDNVMTYISYNEGSRAPTSMELGCANPDAPCKLPNAMAGDPPLKQVVTRSIDLGVKGVFNNGVNWSLAAYHAKNDDDIQFIRQSTSGSALGYFTNVGATSREGVDAALSGKFGKFSWLTSYSYLNATYEDSFQAFVGNNKDKSMVAPGDRIPGIPAHQLKIRAVYQVTPSWSVGTNVLTYSSQYLQGNENNGYYAASGYTGNGKAPGYTVVNFDTKYKIANTGWEVFAKVNNVFDRNYVTGGLQGASLFNQTTNTYLGDDYRTSMFAPGAPRAGWIGVRYEFGGAQKSVVDQN
jgi:outer membrane receptor protein involved in Fe transport